MYGEGNPETPWKDSIPLCHVYRDHSGRNAALTERNQESLYTGSRFFFPPPLPGAGEAKRILQIRKKYDNPSQKHGYHPLQHEPAFPDDKSRVDAGFSYGLALPPDSERPAILTGTDTIRVFVLPFDSMKKAVPHGLLFFIVKTPDWSHTYAR